MTTSKFVRISLITAVLSVCIVAAFAVTAPDEIFARGNSGCEGDKKLENGGTFTAPDGYTLTGICIKAGRESYFFAPGDPGDGCYTLDWVMDGDCYVSVTTGGGGTGRDCKAISHAAVTWKPGDCEKPGTPEDCKNGIDDDGDGLVDCEDGDCKDVCETPEDCKNGIDDDGDGLVDCEDGDCKDVCG